MINSEKHDQIKKFLTEEFYHNQPDELELDTPLVSSGLIDSVSVLHVVEYLEKAFSFEFLPHEVDHKNLDSINKMVEFVEGKTK